MTGLKALHLFRRIPRGAYLYAILAFAAPAAYALYTQHVWEDFFITFRFSQNLCEGKGLVYNEGEKVHGFTSPLGVLLPAFCYLATGSTDYPPALWVFRVFCFAAFALGGALLVRAVSFDSVSRASVFFAGLLYLLDAKSVAFTANGMETAFMLCLVSWLVYLFQRDRENPWLARGLCWAGLMWTRPDGCVYIAALSLAHLTFAERSRRLVLVSFLRSALVSTLVYLPWFAWAWSYYGSPVPNTLVAKSLYFTNNYQTYLDEVIHSFPAHFVYKTTLLFAPIYYGGFHAWPVWIGPICLAVALSCCVYWVLPIADRLGRMASLAFTFLCCYGTVVPVVFPWYPPPVVLLGIVTLARGLPALAQVVPSCSAVSRIVAVVVLATLSGLAGSLLWLTAWQMKIQQQVIENGNRTAVGLWLKDHVRPSEQVFLETLGYIGFFSQARIMDYPGLVSPTVVHLRKERHLDFVGLMAELEPEWVVARQRQAGEIAQVPSLVAQYKLVKTFDVRPELQEQGYIPGAGYLWYDALFLVYHRDRNTTP
jgi:hypothetical protein